jgi:hypothetical protein
VNKTKLLKGAALVLATSMLPISQAANAGEVNISGWINEGLTYYDDGDSSDIVQSADNGTTLNSRIAFTGSTTYENIGTTAGFELTMEPNSGFGGGQTPLLFSTQATFGDENTFGKNMTLLASNIHVGGAWGKVTVGTQSMPTDNIGVLADTSMTLWTSVSPVFRGNSFQIQGGNGATWSSFLQCLTTPGLGIGFDCNGVYRSGVRYDLPAFGPIKVAVGYANDDIYDIAGWYDGSIGRVTAKLHMGYAINQGGGGSNVGASETEVFQLQAGLMDPVTGLFGSVAYMTDEADDADVGTGDDIDAYVIKGGIKKDWFAAGSTALTADYRSHNDMYGTQGVSLGVDAAVTGSEVSGYSFGVTQYFGANFQTYFQYSVIELDVDCNTNACSALYSDAEDLDLFSLGAVYFF